MFCFCLELEFKCFRVMKKIQMDEPAVSFTENGVIEHVELKIYNVRPYKYEKRLRRMTNKWEEVFIMQLNLPRSNKKK